MAKDKLPYWRCGVGEIGADILCDRACQGDANCNFVSVANILRFDFQRWGTNGATIIGVPNLSPPATVLDELGRNTRLEVQRLAGSEGDRCMCIERQADGSGADNTLTQKQLYRIKNVCLPRKFRLEIAVGELVGEVEDVSVVVVGNIGRKAVESADQKVC